MSTIAVTIKSQLAGFSELTQDSSADAEGMRALINYLEACSSGYASASVDVQTSATDPVAATGTLTGATVIATDVAVVGGVSFTYTATPSLETDVMVTVTSAKAFASSTDLNLANGGITESAHGYLTGEVGRLTTSDTLPTGFALSTDYFVIKDTANTYRLASSLANAQAGVAVIPTAVGVGNQTFTLSADAFKAKKLADAINAHSVLQYVVKATYAAGVTTITALQKGLVGNYIDISSPDATITASAALLAGGTGGAGSVAKTYRCGL